MLNAMSKKLSVIVVVCFIFTIFFSQVSRSEVYPSKEVELLVTFPVGGMVDLGARVIKPFWEKYLGATMVVNNKPGAGGELGYGHTARSNPDGYLVCNWIVPSAQGMIAARKTTFKNEDFDYIGLQMIDPHVLAMHSDEKRFQSPKEFLQFAKNNPGLLKIGVSSIYSDDHMALEKLARTFKIDVKPVYFQGSAKAREALLGKYIDCMIDNTLIFDGFVGAGKPLKVLAYLWKERIKFLDPEAPTWKEATGLEFDMANNRGFMTVKGVPADRLAKLRTSFKQAMEDPEYIKAAEKRRIPVGYMSGEELDALTYETQKLCNEFWKK